MAEYNVLPDLESVVGRVLRNAGYRAYSSMPRSPEFPLIIVQRLGGPAAERHYFDAARIQLDVWGAAQGNPEGVYKTTIHDIAQEARVVLHEVEGTTFTEEGISVFVHAVEDSLGLQWLPDGDTGRERYLFGVTVYGRNMSTTSS